MATIPGLAISNRCQVWRLIVKQLLADKLLASTGVKWQVGNALDDDKTRFSKAAKIAITLQPKFGNSEWYSFEAQRGPLVIQVTMEIEGYDVEDPMNLWLALCRACYPLDSVAREKFRSALVNQSTGGAETGEIEFVNPVEDPQSSPEDGRWRAVGHFQIFVIESLTGAPPR